MSLLSLGLIIIGFLILFSSPFNYPTEEESVIQIECTRIQINAKEIILTTNDGEITYSAANAEFIYTNSKNKVTLTTYKYKTKLIEILFDYYCGFKKSAIPEKITIYRSFVN